MASGFPLGGPAQGKPRAYLPWHLICIHNEVARSNTFYEAPYKDNDIIYPAFPRAFNREFLALWVLRKWGCYFSGLSLIKGLFLIA